MTGGASGLNYNDVIVNLDWMHQVTVPAVHCQQVRSFIRPPFFTLHGHARKIPVFFGGGGHLSKNPLNHGNLEDACPYTVRGLFYTGAGGGVLICILQWERLS